MITAKKKNDCYTAFLEGQSLRKLSTNFGISRRTLERWCSGESWMKKRNALWNSLKRKACQKYVYKTHGKRDQIQQQLFEMIQYIHQEQLFYSEGKIPKKGLKYSLKDLTRLAKCYTDLVIVMAI